MTTSSKSKVFDVVIVGAGGAASACALEIAASGQTAAMICKNQIVSGMESLSPAASEQLETLGVKIGKPFSDNTAWWGSSNKRQMPCNGARIVQREELASKIRSKAQERAVPVYDSASELGFSRTEQGWRIECETIQHGCVHVEARFIIDASGRSSFFGRAVKSRRLTADKLCCVSVPVFTPQNSGTWTESVSDGWWNVCSDGEHGTLSYYSMPNTVKSVMRDFQSAL